MTKEKYEEIDGVKVETVPRRYEFDAVIEDYITESEQRETIPKMTLYKYDNDKPNGGGEKEFIGYFSNKEIPDKHKIGLMFGGGRFQAFLYQPRGKGDEDKQQAISFRIGHVYDEMKKQHDEQKRREDFARFGGSTPAGSPQVILAQPPAGASTAAESFVMVKELIGMLTPIIKAQASAPPPPAAAPDLMTQYAVMQNILKKNLFDTAETYRNFSRRFNIVMDQDPNSIEDGETEPEPKEPGIMAYVEKIIKMIEPFFGLLAQKGPAAQVTAQTVRAAPQFAELLNDPQLCRLIIQYFDRTKGADASDVALKNLGINRASLFAAPGPGGRTANQSAAAHGPGNALRVKTKGKINKGQRDER